MSIKDNAKRDQLSKKRVETPCTGEQTIIFSYKYFLENDKKYSMKYFAKVNNEAVTAINELTNKLKEMSVQTPDEFYKRNKKTGFEYIPLTIIEQNLQNSLIKKVGMTRDEKVLSVRFNHEQCRVILKRGTKCRRVFHILAYDFGMQAYHHGS
ncbi:MAG: hypothetical protein HFK07_01095 [Clostridia bacterium]|jgi:uncharacterized protein YehS (DUF1456 family)|nr:hypothetical protein [Clostridia bacterium]MCX4367566.1 hypothetical protein [Clostridia bacterium]